MAMYIRTSSFLRWMPAMPTAREPAPAPAPAVAGPSRATSAMVAPGGGLVHCTQHAPPHRTHPRQHTGGLR
jgi:hypothetical protein